MESYGVEGFGILEDEQGLMYIEIDFGFNQLDTGETYLYPTDLYYIVSELLEDAE